MKSNKKTIKANAKLQVIILAAGEGKRMQSNLPKVLHKIGGLPMLERVVNTAKSLKPKDIFVVYGNGGEQVPKNLSHLDVTWIKQGRQLGTGHAVLQVMPKLDDACQILILYGDVPLISENLLNNFLKNVDAKSVGIITTILDDPTGYGRIVRDKKGFITAIIEQKDTFKDQQKIQEINTGIMLLNAKLLKKYLPKLKTNNTQKEYYLTDVIKMAGSDKHSIKSEIAINNEEVMGINDRYQLACLERYHQYQNAKKLMQNGTTIMDPNRFDLRGNLKVGKDVSIDVNVIIEGNVSIDDNSIISSNVILKDSKVGKNVNILANSIIDGAIIGDDCNIGPFARIRPTTHLKNKAKVGNFVEVKNTNIDEGSKVPHLSYVGDSEIGKNVNIGAGTITCNYDGVNKYKTIIEDNVFIGSNSQLVAPVKIGKNAVIGAGSTIVQNAPSDKLTIARARQIMIENWQRPVKGQLKKSKD